MNIKLMKMLCLGMVSWIACAPVQGYAQIRDVEEERFTVQKTGIADIKQERMINPKVALVKKEVRYIAGPDKLMFTQDDQVYLYYLKDLDAKGVVLKKSTFKPGKDAAAFTADDELQDYQVMRYGRNGKLEKELGFDATGHKQFTAAYAYDADGKKTRITRFDPRNKKIRVMTFTYNPQGLIIRDEEYVPEELEKYHRFEYDSQGRLSRAVEYHTEKNGKGPDGQWFTGDDAVSSAKEYFYSDDGREITDKKYISAGADGKWFTPDDEMQYYTISEN
ncbi:MAG TPA: hypothetical protein P5110_09950 [Candidatus Omnitrophota bacterium]|nr:hypothetical protein [Candidatus Omnitrophota bacterium]HRZ15818.1 hypothetical protein [Candidatus Omnitrophota bacterium]